MKQLKWEYTLTLFFVACSLLILILIIWQGNHRENYRKLILQEINSVKSSGFALQDLPSTQFNEHPIADFHEMVERPLFFVGRLPIETENAGIDTVAVEEVKPAADITLSLIGVINTPEATYALFHDPKAKPDEPKFKHLKQGQKINGWQIKEIKYDRVIISADKKINEILLAKPRVHKRNIPKKTRRTNPFKQKIKK